MPNSWIRYPFLYLLVTALAGVLLRGMALLPTVPDLYERLLHAHSHIALLGWGYSALYILYVKLYIPDEQQRSRFLKVNWLFTQVTIVLMFLAFTIQGYGFFSIFFSTVHIFLSYAFALWMWKKIRRREGSSLSVRFAKAGLFFMALSSVGPWGLAVLSALNLTESPWYHAALYFYLHNQYNGWFTLGLFAILFYKLEPLMNPAAIRLGQLQYGLYVTSLLPSFLLSLLWMSLSAGWYIIAILSGMVQFASVGIFFLLWLKIRRQVANGGLFFFALLALATKMVLELASAIPKLQSLAFENRSVVIGYLHLVLLGFVSCMLLAFLLKPNPGKGERKVLTLGSFIFLAGFVGNEVLLFLEGLMNWTSQLSVPYGPVLLFAMSLFMLFGIGMMTKYRFE
ncbi:hypothetical protein FHS18_003222 [Paenibacillus phyllosphaerae]|uniref:Uncharacterized protein n=1 Tax=Paenibacillus phyllosphaerae TaxID=274593 RepID=A0A7W5AYL6_9BACL|nr:hypothetical protein [Paenibacillus phyllosphaerae]MBB3111154.1 hypothetical protein [Paenibacillus phyllosphaerae]